MVAFTPMGAFESPESASQALLSAALGGLLCLVSGCGGSKALDSDPSCACSTCPAVPMVTSTTTVANLTEDAFTSQCAALKGVMEIQPHCGGSNSCRGMSYDTNTQTLSEHTCRGTNTCAGYSCVVCD